MKSRVLPSAYSLAGAVLVVTGLGCFSMPGASLSSSPQSRYAARHAPGAAGSNDVPGVPSGQGRVGSLLPAVLKVNDETVAAAELWAGLHDELRNEARSLELPAYKGYLVRRAEQLIRDKVYEMLVYQKASLRLAPAVQKRLDSYVDAEIRKTVTLEYDGRQRRYEKWLEANGRTLEVMREQLTREVLIRSYLDSEVRQKIEEPTRRQLLDAYENDVETVASFRRPPRRRMSLIDVRTPRPAAGGADRGTARSRILAAQAALEGGEHFADVARQYSDGLHAAEAGAWGWVTKGSVRERFEPAVEALFQLGEGEYSAVIAMGDGFCLVRCDEIDPGHEPTFQSVQPKLKQKHFQAAYRAGVNELMNSLRAKALIEPEDLAVFRAAAVEAALAIHAPNGS